jgi:hypothetical protein
MVDPALIFGIIKTAIGIAEEVTSGMHIEGDVKTVAAFEDLVAQVFAAHKAETGQPMDLSKFQHIDPIQ